ncbi:MAG: glycoside hydrolase family 105 protein [Anaeroplasma sp.]
MKKLGLIFLFFLISLSAVSCNSNNQISDTDNKINNELNSNMNSYIDTLLSETNSYIPSWNREGFKGRWNYIDGVFLNSIVNLYYNLKDTNSDKANIYKSFFIKYINYYINEEGIFIHPETKEANFKTGELDSICESKILFDAYQMTNDQRYLNAIEATYKYLKNMDIVNDSYGNYSHKTTYLDQIWLDGMYMYAPFNARYAVATNNTNELNLIKKQYQFIRENMFDENKKLYYHGFSSTGVSWSNYTKGTSQSFWLRSMGWYIVSLVDILEYYPDGADKVYLINLLQEAVDGLLQYQDKATKMFYQVIDQGPKEFIVPARYLVGLKNTKYLTENGYVDTKIQNYVESSGSSMIAYTLMKGAKLGYLDDSYQEKGREIFEGIYAHSFIDNTLSDICITAGLGPDGNQIRDGSIYYYLAEPTGSNDAKGVGPFIMSYLEYAYDETASPVTPSLK